MGLAAPILRRRNDYMILQCPFQPCFPGITGHVSREPEPNYKTAFKQSDLWFLLIKARLRGLTESLLIPWLIALQCFQL